MRNDNRHLLGVIAGPVGGLIVFWLLCWGTAKIARDFARTFEVPWSGLFVLGAAGLAMAALLGSRVSPIASLLPGVVFAALGVTQFVAIELDNDAFDIRLEQLPSEVQQGFATLQLSGVLLFVGVVLIAGSLFPSRWDR